MLHNFTDLMPGETTSRMEMVTAWAIQTTMICCGKIFLVRTTLVPNSLLDSFAKKSKWM